MEIEDELLRRYQYLYDNKELILSNCIIYDTETDYIEGKIREFKQHLKNAKKLSLSEETISLLNTTIAYYKRRLKIKVPYLSSKPSKGFVDMVEEFTLGDSDITETELYKQTEAIKNDFEEHTKRICMISDLEDRRSKNIHLKSIPAFTVWKILSYVRKRYPENTTVLFALDKYYNLDRYMLANDSSEFGYFIPEEAENVSYDYPNSVIYRPVYSDSVVLKFRGNEFEEEDDYHDINEDDMDYYDDEYPSEFAKSLARSHYVDAKTKKLLRK